MDAFKFNSLDIDSFISAYNLFIRFMLLTPKFWEKQIKKQTNKKKKKKNKKKKKPFFLVFVVVGVQSHNGHDPISELHTCSRCK